MQQNGHTVIRKNKTLQLVIVGRPGQRDDEVFQFFFCIVSVVHSVDGTDAPHPAFGNAQKLRAVFDIVCAFQVCFLWIRVCFLFAAGVLFSVKEKTDVGKHITFGKRQLAVHMINIFFAFFHFLQKPFRVCAVIRKRIHAMISSHYYLSPSLFFVDIMDEKTPCFS